MAGLLARVGELERALAPFARCRFPDGRADVSIAISTATTTLTVGDFRKAAHILTSPP